MKSLILLVLFWPGLSSNTGSEYKKSLKQEGEERVCPLPSLMLYGNPERDWNRLSQIDKKNLEIAMTRCAELYPRSPCLVQFRVVAINKYHGICGKWKSSDG